MKIFQTFQKYALVLGINQHESNRLNWKITMGFLLLALGILSNVIRISSMENLILMDVVEFFFITSTLADLCFCLATIVWRQLRFFEIIESLDKLITESNFSKRLMNVVENK